MPDPYYDVAERYKGDAQMAALLLPVWVALLVCAPDEPKFALAAVLALLTAAFALYRWRGYLRTRRLPPSERLRPDY